MTAGNVKYDGRTTQIDSRASQAQ